MIFIKHFFYRILPVFCLTPPPYTHASSSDRIEKWADILQIDQTMLHNGPWPAPASWLKRIHTLAASDQVIHCCISFPGGFHEIGAKLLVSKPKKSIKKIHWPTDSGIPSFPTMTN